MFRVCWIIADFRNIETLSGLILVDPAGLKPAPHGLKVRCSVTRAPGQQYEVPSFEFSSCLVSS